MVFIIFFILFFIFYFLFFIFYNLYFIFYFLFEFIFFGFNLIFKKKDGCLEYLVFSLIEDVNSFQEHNPLGNVKPFANTFNLPVHKIEEDKMVEREEEKK